MERVRRRLLIPVLVVLVPVALLAGIWLGGHPEALPDPVRNVVAGGSDGAAYDEAIDVLARDYYRELDRDQLLDEALGGAVESLDDRFSAYFAPRAYEAFQRSTQGRFEGVGMSVEEVRDGLRILTVYEGSPAAEGGLEPGDVITEVDGESITGLSSEESTTRIRGTAGTPVELTVRSGGRERAVRLERAEVEIPVVEAELVEVDGEQVGHVRLASFTSGAHGEVRAAVDRVLEQGAGSLVLDLRDNGGGLLNEAVLISSIFIQDGRIVSTRGRNRPTRVYEATGGAIDPDIAVAVLVNENSASASEIVTGALQDRERATVVGQETFGKGVFQEIEPLPNGGALDITVGEYFLPSGRNLGGKGVDTGAGVEPDVEAVDDPETPRDEALRTAARTVT